MQKKEIEESKVINQWNVLNRMLFIYKAVGAALALVCLCLVILALVLTNRNPIVAINAGGETLYYSGQKMNVDLNEATIKRFIERYIRLGYEWDTLNPEKITQQIAPLVTEGFREKEFFVLKQRKEKEFIGKSIKQDIAGLSVQVTKESTIAIFDVVLRIDGVPLIVPTQVSFELVKGNTTEWNPVGLYINGETFHEVK